MFGSEIEKMVAETIVKKSADAIVGTDRDGCINFWNAGCERIFGYKANFAIGNTLDIIIPANLRARHWEGWQKTIATGESRYGAGDLLSVPAVSSNGTKISVEFTIAMIHDDDGNLCGLVATIRDVTEKFSQMKELRKQLAVLST